MKIKHILMLIMMVLTIGFLQPLVMLLGGFTLIAGVLAWIYADLPPEKQNAWESRVAHFMEQLTSGLRKQPKSNVVPPHLDTNSTPKITRRKTRPAELLETPEEESEKK